MTLAFAPERIETWPLARLQPYAKNAKLHGADQVAKIAASMAEFGWTVPCLVGEDGELIAGHGRVLAATQLGLTEAPVIVLGHLTEAQRRAYRIADNKLTELGTWDEALLSAELNELLAEDLDLSLVGFSDGELDKLLAFVPEADRADDGGAGVPPITIPEPPRNPVSRTGDLWILGDHRLLCGDSTNHDDVRRLMNGERAILFATDPPYLVDYDGTNHPTQNKDWSPSYGTTWDDSSQGAELYDNFIAAAVAEAIADDAAWYCWHASRRQAMLEACWEKAGAFVHQQIIWVKDRGVLTRSHYLWKHEPCFMGWIKGKRSPKVAEETLPSTWLLPSFAKDERPDHPTPKPLCRRRRRTLAGRNRPRRGPRQRRSDLRAGEGRTAGQRRRRIVRYAGHGHRPRTCAKAQDRRVTCMTWLYIPPVCLPEPETHACSASPSAPARAGSTSGSPSPSPDIVLWVTSSGTPSPRPSSWRGWRTRPWIARLSGTTLPVSTAAHGAARWTSSLRDIRASRSRSRAGAGVRTTRATSGLMLPASSAKSNRPLSSSRMSPIISASASPKSPQDWSAWATALRQASSRRRKSARPTSVSGCSSSPSARETNWPTPRACSGTRSSGGNRTELLQLWPTPTVPNGGRANPKGTSPTGKAPDGSKKQVGLESVARDWPTPMANDGCKPSAGNRKTADLTHAAGMWMTPTARDHKDGATSLANTPVNGLLGRQVLSTRMAGNGSCEQRRTLNPLFVEALMGWPTGWTGFASVATAWSPWLQLMRFELSQLSCWPIDDGMPA